ncbi:MAG: glycosyltransferase family 4 protein [Bacteroidota bacterium]|nr:glycosyltransferase family 4 protein [Bacteroidota bacterium]
MTYKAAILKRKLEATLMYPFVLLGKIMSPFFSLKTHHQIFIFSPSADIGGAIQVNADLCACFAAKSPLVIFSKKPKNNEFLYLFNIEGVRTIDIHRYVDHKLWHFVNFFFRGIVSSWINTVENPVVIGGESLFFYKVLPHIKKTATRADICHLDTWFNYSQAFIKDIDVRIFSTAKLKRDAMELYEKNDLPQEYYTRLHFIDNKVSIPAKSQKINDTLSVVFIGRGAPQKRVHLIAAVAKKIHAMKLNIHFSFVGDVEKIFNIGDYPFCTFYGNIHNKSKMKDIYKKADVLLLTSAYEGLPMVVMEMMAYGKVVVSTAVGGIPDYIINGENGFLLENDPKENNIIDEAISVLTELAGNEKLLKATGEKSRLYAEKHFSGKAFCKHYSDVLFNKNFFI